MAIGDSEFFTPAWLIDTPEAFIWSAIACSARP